MPKQIASVYALVFLALIFPLVLVCAFFYGASWGNFTFGYDEERGQRAIQRLWLRPCKDVILWGGWKRYLTQ